MFVVAISCGLKTSSDVGKHTLGYAYTLDEEGYCQFLAKQKHCSKASILNKETCEAALSSPEVCMSTVDSWLGQLNSTCKAPINAMHLCLDKATSEEEELVCTAETNKLLDCAWAVERAEWMAMPDVRRGARRKFVQQGPVPKHR